MADYPADAPDRLADLAQRWRMAIERTVETASSVIAYGRSGSRGVVLKIVKQPGDEWLAGEVARAFDGQGMVRVIDASPGAMLLERLDPATPLVDLVRGGADDAATAILCDVIDAMSSRAPSVSCPTVRDWARGFDGYARSGDAQIPADLVANARRRFLSLCESQRRPRLLHGDLHHYNVLYDHDRGWVAIDPKGVIGELEYEIGAALRNPIEQPDLVADPAVVRRRLDAFASRLDLDADRVRAWGFAQAVLSAIWAVEDGQAVDAASPALMLAATLRSMLGDA